MQKTNYRFVNPSAIKMKIARKLVDIQSKFWTNQNCLAPNPPQLKAPKKRKIPILGYFYACDFVTS